MWRPSVSKSWGCKASWSSCRGGCACGVGGRGTAEVGVPGGEGGRGTAEVGVPVGWVGGALQRWVCLWGGWEGHCRGVPTCRVGGEEEGGRGTAGAAWCLV